MAGKPKRLFFFFATDKIRPERDKLEVRMKGGGANNERVGINWVCTYLITLPRPIWDFMLMIFDNHPVLLNLRLYISTRDVIYKINT
jgi:hypothetical protein